MPIGAFAQFEENPIRSPQFGPDGAISFRIEAPAAETVTLVGNWMAEDERVALSRNDEGLWSVTLEALEPELYGYRFMVDDVSTLDPSNLHIKRDGTFRVESVLFVPGDAADLYMPKTGPKGTVHQVWYDSPTLNLTRRMYVYTPPGYESGDASYPVLYLLHGGGGDEDAWTTLGLAPTIMDNLINQGAAVPMIVVMTNGNPDQAAAFPDSPMLEESPEGISSMASQVFERSLVNDVIPFVESHYRVKIGRENRALTGLSMGGLQTMNTTFMHPERFDYIGVMSMGFADLSNFGVEVDEALRGRQIDALKAAEPRLYWIAVGKDDFLYDSVVTMRDELDAHEFDYVYRESDGGHTWKNWRVYLSEFAPMLFR